MDIFKIQKILEISQYSSIYFLLGLVSAFFIDYIFPDDNVKTVKSKSTIMLLIMCLVQISLNGVMIYYINIIAGSIPFFFQLTPNYSPSLIESVTGVAMAISFTFKDLQTSFVIRIRELCKRLNFC